MSTSVPALSGAIVRGSHGVVGDITRTGQALGNVTRAGTVSVYGSAAVVTPPAADALLLETGDYLLLETGDRLLLE